MKITVDEARVEAVLGRLMETYNAEGYPYCRTDVMVPQDPRNLPSSLSNPDNRNDIVFANFLFCLCYYMRGGIKSVTAARSLGKLYEFWPELFHPSFACQVAPSKLAELLAGFGLNFNARQVAQFWVENAGRLVKNWYGDPRAIFEGVTDFESACARIKNDKKGGGFLGFQEKMVSMIIYYLMDVELIDFFYFPIPVDFHVLRVVSATGMVRYEDVPADGNRYSEQTLAAVRQLFLDYATRHQVNPLRLCDAVWLLSESLCGTNPGNQTSVETGRTDRGREMTPIDLTWDAAQVDAFNRSCGLCRIEEWCTWQIPSADYYVRGALLFRGPRRQPPYLQTTLL